MVTMRDPAPTRSQLRDAILSTVRGGLHVLGGMVQVAAGVTRLLAVTAIKAVEVAEAIVVDEEESEPTGSEPTGSEPTGSEPTGSEPTESEPTPKPL